MTTQRSIVSDGAWVASLQSIAALGQIAGIRLLTEMLPPAVFGKVSLFVGIVALVAVGLANPTMQAMLRFYPEYGLNGEGLLIQRAAYKQLVRLFLWVFPLLIAIAIAAVLYKWLTVIELVLLGALISVEIVRMQSTAVLNAIRSHRVHGVWTVSESWGRPLFASILAAFLGASTTLVLFTYFLVSVTNLAIIMRFLPYDQYAERTLSTTSDLESHIWKYTIPLLPLGVLGWISGMADRYLIGTLLSPTEVGLYVAIYGLASRPMLMLGNIVESTIRPVYQQALVEGDDQRANFYLYKWILLILSGASIAIGVAWMGHTWVANLTLGRLYREASYLMPWIVGGYALLILAHIPARICYAHDRTHYVLMIEVVGSICALLFGYVGIRYLGVLGAGVAIPIYFGIQLLYSAWLCRRLVPLQGNIMKIALVTKGIRENT